MLEILIAIVHSGWDEGMMEQDVLSPKSVLENKKNLEKGLPSKMPTCSDWLTN